MSSGTDVKWLNFNSIPRTLRRRQPFDNYMLQLWKINYQRPYQIFNTMCLLVVIIHIFNYLCTTSEKVKFHYQNGLLFEKPQLYADYFHAIAFSSRYDIRDQISGRIEASGKLIFDLQMNRYGYMVSLRLC